jgi:predicted murein hydrolase (TIGR00659 family)
MTPRVSDIWVYLSASPLLWVTVTLLAYQVAYGIYRRSGLHPLANPVLISVTVIVGVLLLTNTPYQTYFDGAQLMHVLLGPATVALAIPHYAQLERLKTMLLPLMITILVGSVTAIGSAVAIGWVCGASTDILLSLAPKSATMPIAMGVTAQIGGLPSLTALTVTLTGISTTLMARGLLQLMRIDDIAVRGFAIGLTAHAIGTASALQVSEIAGAFAALAMGLNGVATALLLPLMVQLAGSRF